MLNSVELIGNLGKDPEILNTKNGKQFATINLAVTENYKDKNGSKQPKTDWINVTVFSQNIAKVLQSYCHKGDRVYIRGKLQTRSYDKDGKNMYVTEVVVDGFDAKLVMLTNKKESVSAVVQENYSSSNFEDSDIPF